MVQNELLKLIDFVSNLKSETQTIEIKAAKSGAPEKLYDTLSSFSNQDDGGIIIFGISETEGFEVTGVYDAHDLQKRVAEQCQQMEPPVRAVFTVVKKDEKAIVSAEIPPIDIMDRPCHYRAKGRIKGSYIRVADADVPMNEYEVYSYEAYRRKYEDEKRPIEEFDKTLINEIALQKYLLLLKERKPNLATMDDETVMRLMGITKSDSFTLAAVMMFSILPQTVFPQFSIIATRIPGTKMGDTIDDNIRFLNNKRIEGTLPEMLDGALQFVKNNMRIKTAIDKETGIRTDVPEYPMDAVREIILNALVHRDYSIHTEGMPIQLKMFEDRLEVVNPGGLYGRITIDSLGKLQPDTRNPIIANMMEVLSLTENRYSGIPTIRKEMMKFNLPEPEFCDNRGEFCVTLWNSDDTQINSDDLLDFCETPRTRREIADFFGVKTASYVMRRHIDPLIKSGNVGMTIPETPNSKNQKYYTIARG